MTTQPIPFSVPYVTGDELGNVSEATRDRARSRSTGFAQRCRAWFEREFGCECAVLTHSCTAALELAALVSRVGPGDEVIVPTYTYVSSASAFALRGATIVFVDVQPDTCNIDPQRVEEAVTPNTRAIVPVHYAGVGCEMTSIMTIAQRHRLLVVEDAAQGLIASIDGAALGSVGDFGTLSFHETKNVNCGRGGALLVNNPEFAMGTELAMENGCDRAKFHRGEVSRYTWRTLGSSFQMGELSAAYLSAQLEHAAEITEQRLRVWASYHEMLCGLESEGWLTRPQISTRARHNGHIYYVMLAPGMDRDRVLQATARQGIECSSHFVPLHDSPAGAKYGRTHGPMTVSNDIAARIVRLPLWPGMNLQQVMRVVETLASVVRGAACSNDRPALV